MAFQIFDQLRTAWHQSAKPFDIADYIAIIKLAQEEFERRAKEIGGHHAHIKFLPPTKDNERIRFEIEGHDPDYYPGHPRLHPPRTIAVFTISDHAPAHHEYRIAVTSLESSKSINETMNVSDLLALTQQEIKRATRTTRTDWPSFMDRPHVVDEIFAAAKAQRHHDSRIVRAVQIHNDLTTPQPTAAPAY